MEPKLTNSIEEFRKKYGILAPTLAEDFDFYIDDDFVSLKKDAEVK